MEVNQLSWFFLFDLLCWVGFDPSELSSDFNLLLKKYQELEPVKKNEIESILKGEF